MSLKKQLERYKQKKKQKSIHETPISHEGQPSKVKERRKFSKEEIYEKELRLAAQNLHADIKTFDNQMVLIRSKQIDLDEKIGPYTGRQLFDIISKWQELTLTHPLSAQGLKAEELLFFDTETTGLDTGAGNMIFLIGFARVSEDGIILKQYFLPGPGHETAFYYHFLTDCKELKHLVTYNGKAFDWPRVKSRYQFVQDRVPKLPAFGHFDLLHASRRLWKNRLEQTRLQTVEKEILGIDRGGDIPGHMAPFLYFQFLKQPKASLVEGVIEHNFQDILTLISLYIHLSIKCFGEENVDDDEQFEIARWFQYLKCNEEAIARFEKLINSSSSSEIKVKANLNLGELYKKQKNYSLALKHYLNIIETGQVEDESTYIEVAKLFEHQYKDIDQALKYTQCAMRFIKNRRITHTSDLSKKMEPLIKRENRLKRKGNNKN
ncbi:ribonuclease H-like domain-containing protein [Terrilactibacillus laevilacticus]|uniref:Ribonuclease H-like domain-containing protein n=1 Tax=Terrilactibacillus laevilacticus TaxID=1380157 RepID=A0ABW5PPB0_9BACI|nr:ribonuclease H-like domain-containing protein [Terrilactibacillus laevilacticus]